MLKRYEGEGGGMTAALSDGHSEECIRGAHWKEYPPISKLLGYKPAKGKMPVRLPDRGYGCRLHPGL